MTGRQVYCDAPDGDRARRDHALSWQVGRDERR